MNCAAWRETIALEAGGDAVEGVERHVAECRDCAAFSRAMRESIEAVRSLRGEEIEAAHYSAVRARVMAELARPKVPWLRWAWAAAAVAAVMVLSWPRAIPVPQRGVAMIQKALLPNESVNKSAGAQAKACATTVGSGPVRPKAAVKRTPLVVQLQTADPNIVIYWIAD